MAKLLPFFEVTKFLDTFFQKIFKSTLTAPGFRFAGAKLLPNSDMTKFSGDFFPKKSHFFIKTLEMREIKTTYSHHESLERLENSEISEDSEDSESSKDPAKRGPEV